eukprot:12330093-Karenia_brevis.AAC.1
MRTTISYTEAMNVINAEGKETTIKTTKRLESRVQDTSLGEADELNENGSRVHNMISEGDPETKSEILIDRECLKLEEGLEERDKAKSECSNANAIVNDGSMKKEIKVLFLTEQDKSNCLVIEWKTCKLKKAMEPETKREDKSTLRTYQALAHRTAECKSQAIL